MDGVLLIIAFLYFILVKEFKNVDCKLNPKLLQESSPDCCQKWQMENSEKTIYVSHQNKHMKTIDVIFLLLGNLEANEILVSSQNKIRNKNLLPS